MLEALARYGIHDIDLVLFDTWAYGGLLVHERYRDRRVGWTDVWVRDAEDSNPYANPLSGLTFVVDMNTMELLEVEDQSVGDRPRTMGEYVPALVPGQEQRDGLKPLRSPSRRACPSRSTATGSSGSAGRCGSGSTRARAS